MDVVLEAFDRYLFDYVYATVLPANSNFFQYDLLKDSYLASNATLDSIASNYRYTPASQYVSFPPTQYAYQSQWARDNIYRQAFSLYIITTLFGTLVYFLFATLSYFLVFDHATFNHPKYLKNQISLEIRQTLTSLPLMAIFTVPFFLLEVQGYSKMYDLTSEGPGWWYNILQFPLFLCFTDFCIYWIHRGLHHPMIYKKLHKPHHKWIMPTPFASHAFHPLDGYAQSVPYHVFPFIFPLQKFAYVLLFVWINIWTVLIHDGEYVANSPIINGAACHTMHHLYFNYNYGQFTTLWDRLGGSYRKPNEELFRRETKMGKGEWERQSREMEMMVREVEGGDDRTYLPEAKKEQ
ncbi:MAG: c-5 sterol desaturase [Bogoriella megaspora]|nr:MAG: c-5 sterol desaturase [Bogoriella megaspora]